MAEDRIYKPGCPSDEYVRREMIEHEFKPLKPDTILGWVTGPGPDDFEFNPEVFPPRFRRILYRREPPAIVDGEFVQSDWFVRVGGPA